jgi:hypothetical protein
VDAYRLALRYLGDRISDGGNYAGDLMPERQRQRSDDREPGPVVDIRSADSGRSDIDHNIVCGGGRLWHIPELQRRTSGD